MSSCCNSPNVAILDIVIAARDLIYCLSCSFRNFVSILGNICLIWLVFYLGN